MYVSICTGSLFESESHLRQAKKIAKSPNRELISAPAVDEPQLSSFPNRFDSRSPLLFFVLIIILLLSAPLSAWPEQTSNTNIALPYDERTLLKVNKEIPAGFLHDPREQAIDLTPEEQAWLAEHPDIKFGFTDSFEPFLIKGDNGENTGVLIEFLNELNAKLGTQFGVEVDSWPIMLDKAKNKKTSGILAIARETAEANGFLKTETTFVVYPSFFIRSDAPFTIKNLDDIRGRSVAILKSAQVMENILEPYRDEISILKLPNNLEPLQMLFEGKVDLAFGLTSQNYFISKYKLSGIKPAYTLWDRPTEVGMGIRSDWPELVSILNKGIASFSQEEINALLAKWINAPVESSTSLKFTEAEKAWLEQDHTVQVRITDSAPYLYLKDGQPVGIAVDLINKISERSGIKFHFVIPSPSFFTDLKRLIQHKGPDIIATLMPTPEREKNILFTQSYISSPRFIFIRDDAEFVASMENLSGKTVAVIKDYVVHTDLARNYPDINLLICNNNEDALKAVSFGKASAFIGDLISTPAMINEFGLKNLKAVAPSSLSDHSIAMGIRNDWPELRDIMNKALVAIPPAEKAAIINKWSSVKFDYGITGKDVLKWILLVAGTASGVVLFFVFWNKQLSRKVEERTRRFLDSELRFRGTFEQVAVGVAHVSKAGRFLRMNQKFCDMLGYSQEEMLDLTFQDIIHPEDLHKDLENTQQVLNGEKENYSIEKRYYCKDGAIIWVNLTVTMLFSKEGLPKYFIAVVQDISKRKQFEKNLIKSEEKYRGLVDNSIVGVFAITLDGQFMYANDAMAQMFDFDSPEQMTLQGSVARWRDPKERERMVALLQEHGSVTNFQAETITSTGRLKDVIFSAKLDNALISGMVMDISERKQAEVELKKTLTEISELKEQLEQETLYLRQEITLEHNYKNIIGNSNAIKYVLFKVEQISGSDTNVFIQGETGTGKELIARAIHNNSQRKKRPLIKINCATLPANLIESELFGHERGSFTSAIAKQLGRFEIADGSTIFLDEIGELPLELQAKLLRVIEHGEFERLGSSKTIKVDVRIIAATNRDLEKESREGRFRKDLWYRLNVFPITIPPLRDRDEDIPLLVQYFLDSFAKKHGKDITSIAVKEMKALQGYDWPGNVRELEHIIERAVITSSGTKLCLAEDLKPYTKHQTSSETFKSLHDMERDYIIKVLNNAKWKVSGKNSAAEILSINRSTLRAKMKRMNIHKPHKP